MATPAQTVGEYLAAILRTKLLDEQVVRSVGKSWLQQSDASEKNVDAFRKYLVAKKLLTEYQAALIQRGREDGFLIGDYVIQDRIGSGQMAGVYKARHHSGQILAVKVLPGSKARDPNCLNRFQREGRLLTQLDHPNVVRAFQVCHVGGLHFIAMEHLEGVTLDAVLEKRKRLPHSEAVRLVWQAFQGLQHLHDKHLIHRDLKPANLMLVPNPKPDTLHCTVKILDIGLGRELFEPDGSGTQDLHLTSEGAILGTPDYLAPEQAKNARQADIRADIYSLGCVLYHLLTGRVPFPESNVLAQMIRHATEPVKPVSAWQPSIPVPLSKVVDRLLAKNPDHRPATPRAAAEFLKPYLPSESIQAESTSLVPAYSEWLATESDLVRPAEIVAVPAGLHSTHPPATDAIPEIMAKTPQPKINVELVELPTTRTETLRDQSVWPTSRRDWLLLGSGGLLMGVLMSGGYLTTRIVKRMIEPQNADPR